MDSIQVKGIEFWGYHGVLDSERKQGQRFVVDICFALDTSCCGEMLSHTVHYGELAQDIVDFCQKNSVQLIETLANELSAYLLLRYPIIEALELTIHKPNAPIPLSFSDVSIRIARRRTLCYLGLGSNLGNRAQYLDFATEAIQANGKTTLLQTSTYYETKPYGVTDQPTFLNAVLKLETIFTPMELLYFCQNLEQEAGRIKTRHWGERSLDVDILLFGKEQIDRPTLIIPHPQIALRRFVLVPLCELSPSLVHPQLGRSMQELLSVLPDDDWVVSQNGGGTL